MQNTFNTDYEVFKDSDSESQWDDDDDAADEETSESWTEPWDMPAAVNCTSHSDRSASHSSSGLHDVTATASKDIPQENLNAKGYAFFLFLFCFLSFFLIQVQMW